MYPYNRSQGDDWMYNVTVNKTKYGDAIYETSMSETGRQENSWMGDSSRFSANTDPFFIRGMTVHNKSSAGVFAFHGYSGNAYNIFSFRLTLVLV